MYDPKGNGKDKAVAEVRFEEAAPPAHLARMVHRYLHLYTSSPLAEDYRFHALPDACIYLVFDQSDARITGASRLRATSEEFNLGKSFHFVNVRFLPGVWQDSAEPVAHGQLTAPYTGYLPLIEVNAALQANSFDVNQARITALIEQLAVQGMIAPNPVTEAIFANLDDIHTVADMAEICDLSARQLQRVLKRTTGFAPHDFLKIIRLQLALSGDPGTYADQSHFIHSFRRATGYTPGKYAKKFDV